MQKFKDRDGKTWQIELTVGSITRIKQDSGGRFNLFDPDSLVDGRSLASIVFAEHLSDWATLWELVYFAVEGEKPDAAEFGAAMAGDCLVAAQRALIEEWRDFFRLLQRPDLALVLEKRLAYQTKAIELVNERIKSPQLASLDAKVNAKLESALNESLGNLEGKLASILDPSPSGS